MLSLFKAFAKTWLMPVPLAGLLVLGGALVWLTGRQRAGSGLMISGSLLLLLAAWNPLGDTLLRPIEHAHVPVLDASALQGIQAVVVLGSGWSPDPSLPALTSLGESAIRRLTEGVRLACQLPEVRLILSGGRRKPEDLPVAEGYARAAVELGVARERMLLLEGSRTTAQEAYAVRAALGAGQRLLLVTSASHMPRAMRHFEQVGLKPVAAPTHYRTSPAPARDLSWWLPSASGLDKTERALYERLGGLFMSLDHTGQAAAGAGPTIGLLTQPPIQTVD